MFLFSKAVDFDHAKRQHQQCGTVRPSLLNLVKPVLLIHIGFNAYLDPSFYLNADGSGSRSRKQNLMRIHAVQDHVHTLRQKT